MPPVRSVGLVGLLVPAVRPSFLRAFLGAQTWLRTAGFIGLMCPPPDFKSPTRRSRPRPGVFRSSSPHNESDIQQDIIWDAASPSPRRLGKLVPPAGKRPWTLGRDPPLSLSLCLCPQASEAEDSKPGPWTSLRSFRGSLQRSVACRSARWDRSLLFSRPSSLLKHGRPEAAESALQQWIGDSATIPCTPELQVSRAKRSPRWVQDPAEDVQ